MNPADRRAARIAQAKHRGTKHSISTTLENTLILLAWEAEVLSEGQVSAILDLDRVTLRNMRLEAIDKAAKLAESLRRPRKVSREGQDE